MGYFLGDVYRLGLEDGKITENGLVKQGALLHQNMLNVMEYADTKMPIDDKWETIGYLEHYQYPWLDYFDRESLVPISKEEAKKILRKTKK